MEQKQKEMLDEELLKLRREQNSAQNRNRNLLNRVIDSNDKELIKKTIDYIYAKSNCLFSPCQFLFAQIYKIEKEIPATDLKIKSITVDLSELDESINLSNDIEMKIQIRIEVLRRENKNAKTIG